MLWLVFVLATACVAEWPPKDCSKFLVRKKRGPQALMLTGKNRDYAENVCRLTETYDGNVYIDFERTIEKEPSEPSEPSERHGESHLTFRMTSVNDGRALAEARVFDNRIVLQSSTTGTSSTCQGEFGSVRGVRGWLRLRMNSVADVGKSFVTLALQENDIFSKCAHVELEGVYSEYRLHIKGSSYTIMEQQVHEVTRALPKGDKKSDIPHRLKMLEERLTRIETSVTDQSFSHGMRHRTLQESHSQMEYNLMLSRSLSHSSIKIHFIFNIALIGAAIVCIIYFLKKWIQAQIPKFQTYHNHIL